MKGLLKRIGLPTPPIGKLLRGVGTALGVGGTAVLSGVDSSYAIMVAGLVLVFWITGDLQVAKDFKELIKPEK